MKLDWKEVFGAKIYKAYLWQGEVVASRTILEAQCEDHKLGFSVRFDPTQLSFYQVSADVDHTPIANAPLVTQVSSETLIGHLLALGVGDYGPEFGKVDYSVLDALRVAETFPNRGFAVATLLNRSASKRSILERLEKLATTKCKPSLGSPFGSNVFPAGRGLQWPKQR